jgi:hypothetical protein
MSVSDWIGAFGGFAGGAAAAYVALRTNAIERYRARLKEEGIEHEIRFTRLHERRIEVTGEIYRNLVRAERAFASWARPLQMASEPSWEEKGRLAADAGTTFIEHFHENRIWLDEDLVGDIQSVNDRIYEAYVGYTTYRRDDPRLEKDRLDAWMKAWKQLSEDVPTLRGKIERRIRGLLGVAAPGEL